MIYPDMHSVHRTHYQTFYFIWAVTIAEAHAAQAALATTGCLHVYVQVRFPIGLGCTNACWFDGANIERPFGYHNTILPSHHDAKTVTKILKPLILLCFTACLS